MRSVTIASASAAGVAASAAGAAAGVAAAAARRVMMKRTNPHVDERTSHGSERATRDLDGKAGPCFRVELSGNGDEDITCGHPQVISRNLWRERDLPGCHRPKRTRNNLRSHSRACLKLTHNLEHKRSKKIAALRLLSAWHGLRSLSPAKEFGPCPGHTLALFQHSACCWPSR